MRVLIAEDEPISRVRLARRLDQWGYDVVLAKDGAEAWGILEAPDAPSIAIVDWLMPGIDGTELCRRVRSRRREAYTYLILLTGKGEQKDIVEGLGAGADDYLKKPFDVLELEARVRGARRIIDLQTELLESRRELLFQATHDALTGAWNRRAALEAVTRELARSQRERTPLGVLLVDLDHFKRVNDVHGHLAGDAVLVEAARRMTESLRPYDLLGRYGGEEFVVVLPDCSPVDATTVAERLRACVVSAPIVFGTTAIQTTCSVGVCSTISGLDTVEAIIDRADAALYRAKDAGRNRIELAVSSVRPSALRSVPPRSSRVVRSSVVPSS